MTLVTVRIGVACPTFCLMMWLGMVKGHSLELKWMCEDEITVMTFQWRYLSVPSPKPTLLWPKLSVLLPVLLATFYLGSFHSWLLAALLPFIVLLLAFVFQVLGVAPKDFLPNTRPKNGIQNGKVQKAVNQVGLSQKNSRTSAWPVFLFCVVFVLWTTHFFVFRLLSRLGGSISFFFFGFPTHSFHRRSKKTLYLTNH